MKEYVAMYRCRQCGEEFATSLISEEEVSKCFDTYWRGKYIYHSRSGRNDIPKEVMHFCTDGSLGFADFIGFMIVRNK